MDCAEAVMVGIGILFFLNLGIAIWIVVRPYNSKSD